MNFIKKKGYKQIKKPPKRDKKLKKKEPLKPEKKSLYSTHIF